MSERIGKWLTAEERLSASGKTSVFAPYPKDDQSKAIGFIGWYGPWRRYALQPEPNTVFEADCLAALAKFCSEKTLAHRRVKALVLPPLPGDPQDGDSPC